MALRQQKRVIILFWKLKRQGFFSVLYLDAKNNNYWRINKASLHHFDELRDQDFELCLDGFMQTESTDNFAALAFFRIICLPCLSVQYNVKDDKNIVRKLCLIPFWSKSDLNKIGNAMNLTELKINRQYYSGLEICATSCWGRIMP
jgi:hypothetical protein